MPQGFGAFQDGPVAPYPQSMMGTPMMPQPGGPLMMRTSPSPGIGDPLLMRQPLMEYPRPGSPGLMPQTQPMMQPMQRQPPMMQPMQQQPPMMQPMQQQQPPMMQPMQQQQPPRVQPMQPMQQPMMQQPMMQPTMQPMQQREPRPMYPQLPPMQDQPPMYRRCGSPSLPQMRTLTDTADRGQDVWFHAPHLTSCPQPQRIYGSPGCANGPHVTQIVVSPDGRRTPPMTPPQMRRPSPMPSPTPADCPNCGAPPEFHKFQYMMQQQPQFTATSAGSQGHG